MNILERITKYSDLEQNDSLSCFDKHAAQQTHNVYQIFYEFLNEHKPKRILEIGTALGGFTRFLKSVSDESNLDIEIRSYDVINLNWYDEIRESGVDLRTENIFIGDFEDIIPEVKEFIRSEGLTLVLCDGGYKIGEFNLISDFIKEGDMIMAHDYSYDLDTFKNEINGKIWNWCEITENDILPAIEKNSLKSFNENKFKQAAWVCKIK
jgi:hypothetical protein